MAHVHNALHRATGLLSAFGRALGERDASFAGIERAGETLTPMIDLWSRAEWSYLRDERIAAVNRFVSPAGGAGTEAAGGLCNPTGSNRLIVVERVSAGILADTYRLYNAADSAVELSAGVQQGFSRDTRLGNGRNTVGLIRWGFPAAVGADWEVLEQRAVQVANNYTDFQALPVVLPPGRMLVVAATTSDTVMSVNFVWRERQALPGELE